MRLTTLGLIVHSVPGQPYEQYVMEHILESASGAASSRGVTAGAACRGADRAVNLAWVWAVPYLTAGFSTDSLALLESNDVGWAALVSGGVALFWGVVLRPVLALLVLHRKEAVPGDAGQSSGTHPLRTSGYPP